MNWIIIIGVLPFVVLCLSSTHPIVVKIVKETNTINSPNLALKSFKVKSSASNFTGPTQLLYLVGRCFSYSSDKYEYRVCPFDNITQHEKVWHSGAYNGVIGIWKEWVVKNNSFDSLMFIDGDDCEDNVERSAQLIWICGRDINENTDKVIDIREPEKCFYEIHFASDFGCDDKHIYPHLSDEYKRKWDQIETYYYYKDLTPFGYESALKQLFVESLIIRNKTERIEEITFESKEKCCQQFVLLKEQNVKLEQRVKFLEKQLNKID